MRPHSIAMLGTGLIGDFYTQTLHGQRGADRVRVVYSRSEERGRAFRERWDVQEHTTDLGAAIRHADTDVVVVSHVSPIKAAVAWALGCGMETAWRTHLDQASITRLALGANGPLLRSYNETHHLGTALGPARLSG